MKVGFVKTLSKGEQTRFGLVGEERVFQEDMLKGDDPGSVFTFGEGRRGQMTKGSEADARYST